MDVVDARFLTTAPTLAALPPPAHAEIAFAGRSNVGKSTLLNALLKRKKLVRTSSTPGCTRALQFFRVRLAGDATLDFVDLPGYGFAKRGRDERRAWASLIEGYLTTRDSLRAVVVIVDVRRGVEDEERDLLAFLDSAGRTPILAVTKIDKLAPSKRVGAVAAIARSSGLRAFGVSGETGDGRDALMRALLRAAHVMPSSETERPND